MVGGVYKITCLKNKKIYIGSGVNVEARLDSHVRNLPLNKYENKRLQNAYNKYGEENFLFEIIERCDPQDCIQREQYYLNILLFAQEYIESNKKDKRFLKLGFNVNPIAGSSLGYKRSKKVCEITARKNRGKKRSDIARKNLSEGQKKSSLRKSNSMKETTSTLEFREGMSRRATELWSSKSYRESRKKKEGINSYRDDVLVEEYDNLRDCSRKTKISYDTLRNLVRSGRSFNGIIFKRNETSIR